MSQPAFEIEITKQGWIDPEVEAAPADLCSHGDIRLAIGGRVIVPGEGEHWYTISTSALALLRTLESDHSREQSVADRLILCCGMLEMLTCPIGIDWSVTHLHGRVRLDDIVRYDSVDETQERVLAGVRRAADPRFSLQSLSPRLYCSDLRRKYGLLTQWLRRRRIASVLTSS